MNVYQAMDARRSVRQYADQPVPRDLLYKVVSCGPKAPSGCNEQAWRFVIVDDPSLKAQIAALLRWGRFIADAAACVVICTGRDATTPLQDASAATQNIMLAAAAEGLGTCWVNTYRLEHAPALGDLIGCAQGYEPAVLMALGVPAQIPAPPAKKSMDEVISFNAF